MPLTAHKETDFHVYRCSWKALHQDRVSVLLLLPSLGPEQSSIFPSACPPPSIETVEQTLERLHRLWLALLNREQASLPEPSMLIKMVVINIFSIHHAANAHQGKLIFLLPSCRGYHFLPPSLPPSRQRCRFQILLHPGVPAGSGVYPGSVPVLLQPPNFQARPPSLWRLER